MNCPSRENARNAGVLISGVSMSSSSHSASVSTPSALCVCQELDCFGDRLLRNFLLVVLAGLFLFLLFVQTSYGEIIHFKNGKILQGEVFDDEDDASMLKIILGKGVIRVARDTVERIEDMSDDDSSYEEPVEPMSFGQPSGLEIMDKKFQQASSGSIATTEDGRTVFQAPADQITRTSGNAWAFGGGEGPMRTFLAKAAQVRGEAEVLAEGTRWKKLDGNETISPGTQIRTGNGRVTFYTSEQVELRMAENTHLVSVQEAVVPTIRLESGRVWLKVHGERDEKNTSPRIVILAPNAVAGVRGSLLFLDTKDSESTTIAVFDGQVEILEPETGSELVTLSAEEATRIDSPGQATAIRCEGKWLEQWSFWNNWQARMATEHTQ